MIFVIFDIDGTLTRTNYIDELCLDKTYMHFLEKKQADFVSESFSNVDSEISTGLYIQKHGKKPNQAFFDEMIYFFLKQLQNHYSSNPEYFLSVPGANNILKSLFSDPHFGIGIATGGWRLTAKYKLEKAGIDYKNYPISSAEDSLSREGIIQNTINKLKEKHGEPDKIIYVGDGEWDLRASKNLNIKFVGIDAENNTQKQIVLGKHLMLSSYNEINKLFFTNI